MNNIGEWWTSPTESNDGQLIMVTGRKDIEKFKTNPKFSIRIEITWQYNPDGKGMPDEAQGQLLEKITDAFTETFSKDPIAVLTGIYTGAGERNWVFYTLSTYIFEKKLNLALSDFELLPLKIYAENDPSWQEYNEMKDLTEISASDD